MTAGEIGVEVLDIHDPTSPRSLGFAQAPGEYPDDVDAIDDYLSLSYNLHPEPTRYCLTPSARLMPCSGSNTTGRPIAALETRMGRLTRARAGV